MLLTDLAVAGSANNVYIVTPRTVNALKCDKTCVIKPKIREHVLEVAEHIGVLSKLVYLKEALCNATMQCSISIHFALTFPATWNESTLLPLKYFYINSRIL